MPGNTATCLLFSYALTVFLTHLPVVTFRDQTLGYLPN